MNIDLTDTTTRRIQEAIGQARHQTGGPAVGMVLTLVIVTDESAQYDSLRAATEASREHPCRVLTVISRDSRGNSSRLDAEIRIGETGPGETVLLRMYGPLAAHADSVVLPLLVPDAPVVTWWPGQAPPVPGDDPLGALAQRRVTDSYAAVDRLSTLAQLGHAFRPGDTDFSWTRLTAWRTLLAAALDQKTAPVISAEVQAESDSPSAELLAAWLTVRLGVPVLRTNSDGPGITGVVLTTTEGDVTLTRQDGRIATLTRPGQPPRQVSLHRRPMAELLAEELRRLDPDEVYQDSVGRFAKDHAAAAEAPPTEPEPVPAPAPEPVPAPEPAPAPVEASAPAPAPKPRATRKKAES